MPFRKRTFLLLVLWAAMSLDAGFAYTVILKNGKRVEGTYLEEDSAKLLIKDRDGIVLTFRKSTLDISEMQKLNSVELDVGKPEATLEEQAKTDPDKKSKRVFTNEDLKDLPEISIVGSESPAEFEEQPAVEDSEDETMRAEAYWKGQTARIAHRLYAAEENYERLKAECKAAHDTLEWYILNGYYGNLWVAQEAQIVCDRANQAKTEWEKRKQELEEFQDWARRQGALPGWIDPERF